MAKKLVKRQYSIQKNGTRKKKWLYNGFLLNLLSGIILVVLIIIGWSKITDPLAFPINMVTVEGEFQYIKKREIQQQIMPWVAGGFFNINVNAVKHEIQKEPWVANVTVRRVWPDRVVVRVYEHQPEAFWNRNLLLSREGRLFAPKMESFSLNLPFLSGPAGQHELVLAQYREMNQRLAILGLSIKAVNLTERGAWKVKLQNNMELELGRFDIVRRLQRFIAFYPQILSDWGTEARIVDLRYNNGISVQL